MVEQAEAGVLPSSAKDMTLAEWLTVVIVTEVERIVREANRDAAD